MSESSELLGEVMVVGRAGLDATKTGAAMSINANEIARMPSITNSIADITRLNPQISVSTSGAMSFAGSNNRYNSFMVDGAANNDVFGLTSNGSNGGQAGAQPLSMETVEQIQVSVAPFDVRQSGFTGGAINAITKSGTNEFHGSVYGDWLNQSLIGSKYKRIDGTTSQAYEDEKEYRYGLTVGGPIIKNKL
jgi:outer membrane receptor for ferrienterochelin and colicin